MNTYDFDRTIYINDSSVDFFLYCLKNYPYAVLRILPGLAVMWVRYLLKKCDFQLLKEKAFSYLAYVPEPENAVERFWDKKWQGIGGWYLEQAKSDDIIISASPEFIVCPAGKRLGAEVIATGMDVNTGKLLSPNCHDAEKVKRFYAAHPGAHTENFYSDSDNDLPMAHIAEKAFKVKRGKVRPWE